MEGSLHEAIVFYGNEHEISYNEIQDVCTLTADAGAIYSGRRWDWRANKIMFNHIPDITGFINTNIGGCTVDGIFLDDQLSGEYVFGNIIINVCGKGIFHNGGEIASFRITLSSTPPLGTPLALGVSTTRHFMTRGTCCTHVSSRE